MCNVHQYKVLQDKDFVSKLSTQSFKLLVMKVYYIYAFKMYNIFQFCYILSWKH